MQYLKNWGAWLIPFLAFFIGVGLGPGTLWKLVQAKHTEREYNLEVSRHAGEIRARQYDILLELIELSEDFRKENLPALQKIEISTRIKMQQETFYNFEYKLAILENRSPRDIYLPFLDFVPPAAPSGLTVVPVE